MSSDDGNCGSEDGEECTGEQVMFLVIFCWMMVGLAVNWGLMIVSGPNDLPDVYGCNGILRADRDPGCFFFFFKV
ncbi:hypothetical protein Esi_0044_0061 [Ectocarpus siliculosus]|uniref:Uncharacterized protein n=1 Tax=Ectocarpus siliculosus TaxID=2880 RepID=D8LNC8_ECTSI|nr:hypothetical protein Esi_0044_0061 [Ectocarpus siliculosus]|eukprot:CBN77285.1 hypothetical protein Esi_0044_0061 [Ectocarpus siliculosus]